MCRMASSALAARPRGGVGQADPLPLLGGERGQAAGAQALRVEHEARIGR